MTTITSILSAYEGVEPRRALGGIYALSGFDYQIRCYLAELVESLAGEATALDKCGQVFVEALSDIATKTDDDHLVCIQVKRTLTAKTLKDSAAEVEAIDRFLKAQHPDLRDQVKFKLVASGGDLDLQWSDIPAAHTARPLIDALLQKGRLLQPCIEPDPWWRAIVAVWHLGDPYSFLRFALDRALSRAPAAEDAQRIRDDICERYAQAREGQALPGKLLTPADFQSVANPSSSLEIGREITLARLRDQQYMPRSHRLDALYANLLERKDLSQRDLKSEARVFWLSGRSGVGKSVLLLQTVERLVAEDWRVLWLKGEAGSLEPALRAIADEPAEKRPDFIAIDDLYDRDARTLLDLGRLGEFIDERGHQAWPMILTCGPGEFADSFRENSAYRGFNLHCETVETIAASEAAEIEDWYRSRTGQASQRGTAFSQASQEDNGLFVSLAVELAHGDLHVFAHRLAERVRLNGLDKALYLPLAMNRLYLRAPYDWLTEEDREKLATLNQDGDFSLLEPGMDGEIVRLTHPHLADALYRALRKPANAEAYTNDLISIFRRALADGSTALVLQLMRVFSTNEEALTTERLSIVDRTRLARDCARVWKDKHTQLALDVDGFADASTSWACWATSAPGIGEVLGSDLLTKALDSLGSAYKVWSGCWGRLAQNYPKHDELFAWATEHFADQNKSSYPTWSFNWEYCLQHDPSRRSVWREMGLDWLQNHFRRPDWHFVWKKLLPETSNPDWEKDPVLVVGARRLRAESDGPDWAYVFQDLYALPRSFSMQAGNLAVLARGWLAGREDRAEWGYVWRALVRQGDSLPKEISRTELLRLGAAWLDGREHRMEWSHTWRELLAQRDFLPREVPFDELLRLGVVWLVGREDRPEWAHIWQDLLAQREFLPTELPLGELLRLGVQWLVGREERDEWSYVWRVLVRQGESLPKEISRIELLRFGAAWLVGREDRLEWTHIWQDLLAQREFLPTEMPHSKLLHLGAGWLPGRENNEGWSFVCEAMLDHRFQSSDFIEHAATWLKRTKDRPEWPLVAAKFIVVAPQHKTSADFAQNLTGRIKACPNNVHWFKTTNLISSLSNDIVLSSEVGEWLHVLNTRTDLPPWAEARRCLDEGVPIKGQVTAVLSHSCSVQLEIGLVAILENSPISVRREKGFEHPFFVYKLNPDKGFVLVGLEKSVSLIVGGIYEGRVTGVKGFGVFVRIGQYEGLLHRTKLSADTNVLTQFSMGQSLRVRVRSFRPNGRIEFSLPPR